MPVITMTMAEGQANNEQKHEMVRQFTATAAKITNIPEQSFTILFHDLDQNNIGVAGKPLPELLRERNQS